MGEQGFASALFYTYVCISRDLLVENLVVTKNWRSVLLRHSLKQR